MTCGSFAGQACARAVLPSHAASLVAVQRAACTETTFTHQPIFKKKRGGGDVFRVLSVRQLVAVKPLLQRDHRERKTGERHQRERHTPEREKDKKKMRQKDKKREKDKKKMREQDKKRERQEERE